MEFTATVETVEDMLHDLMWAREGDEECSLSGGGKRICNAEEVEKIASMRRTCSEMLNKRG